MDYSTFISDNWQVVTGFVTGLIAGNPRTVKRLLGIFTAIFALYRLFIFLRELRNPEFRKFLFRIFVSGVLTTSIIFFLVANTGCAIQPIQDDITGDGFPDLYGPATSKNNKNKLFSNSNGTFPLTDSTTNSDVVKVSKDTKAKVDDYFANFRELAKNIKTGRTTRRIKRVKVLKVHDTTFKEERAAVRHSLVVSCNVLISQLRADSKLIAKHSRSFGKAVLKAADVLSISKSKLLELPLNTCEKYGVSFWFRMKHKSSKMSEKWMFCSDFASIGIISADQKYKMVAQASLIKKLSTNFRNDYVAYRECKLHSKTKYFDKLKMGIFPSRRLNDK